MKNAIFIIPYFGKFNNYFNLFLNSCKYNCEYDWLIFTDDRTSYSYPENVTVHYMTFEEMKDLIQLKFDFKISLEHPYKLCDYRPAYGYIFESYIKGYPFWGYCDTDLIWGRLGNFINENDLSRYDKLGILGHGTLLRNREDICHAFMRQINGCLNYKKVFTNSENHSFDEEFSGGINNILESLHYKVREKEYEANIYTKSSDFKLTWFINRPGVYQIEKRKRAFFYWKDGRLFRCERKNGRIDNKEYMYIHLQARPMKVRIPYDSQEYKIIPNSFDWMEYRPVTSEDFSKIKVKHFNLHYFRLRWKNLRVKIKRMINAKKK